MIFYDIFQFLMECHQFFLITKLMGKVETYPSTQTVLFSFISSFFCLLILAIRVVEFSNGALPQKFSKIRVLKVNYIYLLRKENYLKLKSWLNFNTDIIFWIEIHTINPLVYLYLIFEISSVTQFFFNFEIASLKNWKINLISKLIFAGYTGSKNQVRTRQKNRL